MKHPIRTLACGAALLAAIVFTACGGKQTIASKSAAAYDDAKKKGIPIETGEHGGHSAEAGAATATAEQPAMPAMDHSKMAGTDHSRMTGMQHGAQTAAPLDIAPPASNAAIAQTQPAATLRADQFDAPAPTAVAEAARAGAGMPHAMENAAPDAPAPPAPDHTAPPQPAPRTPHPGHHHGSAS